MAVVSTNDISDGEVLRDILDGIEGEIDQVSADGAYDQRKCYDAIREGKAKVAIPPRKGAKIWQHGNSKAQRHNWDENLRQIRQVGRKAWKPESNSHRRSLAETTIFRFKPIFGGKLSSRNFDNQAVELLSNLRHLTA
jgi:hypothetical protein